MQVFHRISQQRIVAIRRFDKQLSFILLARTLLQSLQTLNPLVFFRRQITLKCKVLPIRTRSHQRQQQTGRADQRPYFKTVFMRQCHQIRARIGHSRTTCLADNTHAASLLQRFQQFRQSLQICVFIQRLQIQLTDRRSHAQMFQMRTRCFFRFHDKIRQPDNRLLFMRQQAWRIRRTQRGGNQIQNRFHSSNSKKSQAV